MGNTMDIKKTGIVVVHGIGEQKHLQSMKSIAVNVFKVLLGLKSKGAIKNLTQNIRPENYYEPVNFTFRINSIQHNLIW